MAVELSGDPAAGDILSRLHRGNYYVSMKSGSTGPVYAYHPLLHEFLVTRARETLPASKGQELRRQSAALMEADGMVDDAVNLLNQDQDWMESKRLVLEHAAEMLHHGRADTLENWIDELPEAVLDTDPWLQYWRAACRFLTSQRESRILYEEAFALFLSAAPDDREGQLLTCAGAMDSIIHELDDFSLLDRWIEDAEKLLANSKWQSPKVWRHRGGSTCDSQPVRLPGSSPAPSSGNQTMVRACQETMRQNKRNHVAHVGAAARGHQSELYRPIQSGQ